MEYCTGSCVYSCVRTLAGIGSATCIGCDGKMFRVSAKYAIDNFVSSFIHRDKLDTSAMCLNVCVCVRERERCA